MEGITKCSLCHKLPSSALRSQSPTSDSGPTWLMAHCEEVMLLRPCNDFWGPQASQAAPHDAWGARWYQKSSLSICVTATSGLRTGCWVLIQMHGPVLMATWIMKAPCKEGLQGGHFVQEEMLMVLYPWCAFCL